jgi:hypothetical protein
MKIRNRLPALLVWVLAIGVVYWSVYAAFYRPYFRTPKEDIEFLNQAPAKSEVLKRFNRVDEELVAGDRFEMTGWYPLPQKRVTGSAFSVVRRNGSKIYLFFNPAGKLEEYFIANS